MSVHLARHHLMSVAPRPDIVFVRGEGAWLVDAGGRRYLDWVQGWAVNCLGHAPAVLVDALARQASTLINPGPAFYNAPALELADLLARLSGLDQVFLASSGAEANEGAIKLARKWGQRHKHGAYRIVTFENGFHGRTLATMSASGKPGWDTLFAPQVPGFPKARLNDIDSVRQVLDAETVAVMLEPIQGEAGVIPATAEFLGELRQLCDARGLLLILDEVQTGCGRTGDLFAHQALGVRPDIMTLGKGIGGGVPLAALLASERCACFAPGDQGGTYCGNPLMAAAGAAVLGKLSEPGFLDTTRTRAADLAEGLQALARSANLGEVRGRGMLLALDLGRLNAHAVVDAARKLGLLLNAPRPHCLRFMPALNSTAAEIATGLERLAHAIHVVQSGSGGSAS